MYISSITSQVSFFGCTIFLSIPFLCQDCTLDIICCDSIVCLFFLHEQTSFNDVEKWKLEALTLPGNLHSKNSQLPNFLRNGSSHSDLHLMKRSLLCVKLKCCFTTCHSQLVSVKPAHQIKSDLSREID